MANGNNVALVGNITRDPELRFTPTGPGHGHLRAGREPAVAEPPDPGMGGGHRRSSTSCAGARWPRTRPRALAEVRGSS